MAGVDALLRAADVAMYGAKARGKDRYQVYSTDQDPGDDRITAGRTMTRRPAAPATGAGDVRAASTPHLRPEGA
jgi:hypothetical protein